MLKRKVGNALLLVVSCVLLMGSLSVVQAQEAIESPQTVDISDVRVVGLPQESPEYVSLKKVFDELVAASNRHDIDSVMTHYSPQFISGDNLSFYDLKKLIQETWASYPDIRYQSKVVEVRFNGDWATVETLDWAYATAKPSKDIIETPGQLKSESRSQMFLKRIGDTWEVWSDYTIWEQAVIRYGVDETVKVVLSAPEQIKAGQSYSAQIRVRAPKGAFSIATIDNQELVYPYDEPDDKFRGLSSREKTLQRVLKANSNNHNEMVTATVGLTAVTQNRQERPSLNLSGIVTVVKRVNVLPISSEEVLDAQQHQGMVDFSASGKVDLSKFDKKPTKHEVLHLELAPSSRQ